MIDPILHPAVVEIQTRLRASEDAYSEKITTYVDAHLALDRASAVELIGSNAEARRAELLMQTADERAEVERTTRELEIETLRMKNARAELVAIGRTQGAYPAE
jgi:hypothetical protein